MKRQKLDRKVFEKELQRLCTLLSKLIAVENIELIYNELSWIPTEAWPEIVGMALDNWETWPRNFPRAIKGLWWDWQKGHRATIDFQDCRYCYQTGCLDYVYYDEQWKRELENSCFCGHCNNYLRHVTSLVFTDKRTKKKLKHRRLTIQEIAQQGWKWAEPPAEMGKDEAIAAMDKMFKKLDERSGALRLPGYQQREFDQGRPSRAQSLEEDRARNNEAPF